MDSPSSVYSVRQRSPYDWSVVEETFGMEISGDDILIPSFVPRGAAQQAVRSADDSIQLSLSPILLQDQRRNRTLRFCIL